MTVSLGWNVQIEPGTSPVHYLMPDVVESLERIAPERIVELASQSQGLTLVITDDRTFKCHALPMVSVIQLSRCVVEVAWAFAYSYWQIYQTLFAGRQLSGVVENPRAVPALAGSMRLLDWAMAVLNGGSADEWPSGAPSPDRARTAYSVEHVADEVALCALAMYMHHELAHIYAPRTVLMKNMDEERYCDSAAADWILAGCANDDAILQKRAWGVAVGMLMLTVCGLRSRASSDGIHPPGYVRLVAALDRRVPASQEAVWAMVYGMLALHLHEAGLPSCQMEYDSFKAAAIGLSAHLEVCKNPTAAVLPLQPNRGQAHQNGDSI